MPENGTTAEGWGPRRSLLGRLFSHSSPVSERDDDTARVMRPGKTLLQRGRVTTDLVSCDRASRTQRYGYLQSHSRSARLYCQKKCVLTLMPSAMPGEKSEGRASETAAGRGGTHMRWASLARRRRGEARPSESRAASCPAGGEERSTKGSNRRRGESKEGQLAQPRTRM